MKLDAGVVCSQHSSHPPENPLRTLLRLCHRSVPLYLHHFLDNVGLEAAIRQGYIQHLSEENVE